MSKIVRRMSPMDRLMNSGLSRRELAHMEMKHRRWPLGTRVIANTPIGRLPGQVNKHWRSTECPGGCCIEFSEVVDLGDANGPRYCHRIAFRNLKPVK